MRALVASLFALAVASTLLAGDGVVLIPHTHALGTPAEHPHGLAMYRFPIALLGAPLDAPLRATGAPGVATLRMGDPLAETLAGATLLLLGSALIAFAPRIARRARASLITPDLRAQWSALTPTGPPRPLLPSRSH